MNNFIKKLRINSGVFLIFETISARRSASFFNMFAEIIETPLLLSVTSFPFLICMQILASHHYFCLSLRSRMEILIGVPKNPKASRNLFSI